MSSWDFKNALHTNLHLIHQLKDAGNVYKVIVNRWGPLGCQRTLNWPLLCKCLPKLLLQSSSPERSYHESNLTVQNFLWMQTEDTTPVNTSRLRQSMPKPGKNPKLSGNALQDRIPLFFRGLHLKVFRDCTPERSSELALHLEGMLFEWEALGVKE